MNGRQTALPGPLEPERKRRQYGHIFPGHYRSVCRPPAHLVRGVKEIRCSIPRRWKSSGAARR
ncbi:hypothetical protein SPHINGO8AM_40022 [Sphingomonas sp. 8AM]|nr:hypothetical protein SPHINGO8AM_40022 [Sphingomonas sp. 8AM]